jgi:hypothetical protein
MAETADKFDQWAIVELMGHRKLAGRVSEEIRFGVVMCRIDVPDVFLPPDSLPMPGFTQFYGGSSLYSVTPTSEEVCRRFTTYHRERPVEAYELPQLRSANVSAIDQPAQPGHGYEELSDEEREA